MRDDHLVKFMQETPWAILPERLETIVGVLRAHVHGKTFDPSFSVAQAASRGGRVKAQTGSAVAVIPIYGIIAQRANLMMEWSGGTSTEELGKTIQAALDDNDIGSLILDIDSPGGSVYGVAEVAEMIFQARGSKPITAVANSMAASAAYWIATAADKVVVTPSGDVGSIGVYSVHTDFSKYEENEGVKTTYISAGKYKVEGNSSEPLGDEARDHMQSRVDEYHGEFVGAVARHRGVGELNVRNGYGQGRVLGAKAALNAGMVDEVATLDETITRMASGEGRTGMMAAQDETVREVAELVVTNVATGDSVTLGGTASILDDVPTIAETEQDNEEEDLEFFQRNS